MKKRYVNHSELAEIITAKLPRGILLTTNGENKPNTMVIGWGAIGSVWEIPAFTVYVRESRYTRELLDKNPEFTINCPAGDERLSREVYVKCGTLSGRDIDKFKECGLTAIAGDEVSVPAIKEYPITLECKVLYRQLQDFDCIPQNIKDQMYPVEADGKADKHYAYIGKIVKAYIIED